jgi:hypothetical protein
MQSYVFSHINWTCTLECYVTPNFTSIYHDYNKHYLTMRDNIEIIIMIKLSQRKKENFKYN